MSNPSTVPTPTPAPAPAPPTSPGAAPGSVPCRNCGLEIVRGVWFDSQGSPQPGWTHVGGGLICVTGHLAAPRQAGPAEPSGEVRA